MRVINEHYELDQYSIPASEKYFSNSLPVLHYRGVLSPGLFLSFNLKRLFRRNNWYRFRVTGLLTYHHYHSNAHLAVAVLKGNTSVQFGGENGPRVAVNNGDLLVIPAGVVHKNLGDEHHVSCLTASCNGIAYDMNCGHPSERPAADYSIQNTSLPESDPIFGNKGPLTFRWSRLAVADHIYGNMAAGDAGND